MSREYPDRPYVGVGVVVLRGDDVLLIRRLHSPRQGEWSLPGGLQELGETVFEAACREVREESGIDVDVIGVAEVVDLIERDENRGAIRFHYTLIDVAAVYRGGEPCPGDDAGEAIWANVGALRPYGLWPETERVIARAAAIIASHQR